jgi:DnaJ-class molecular chaperone
MKDPYQVLGVPKSAAQAEIKSAYRKLAKELHPDRNPNNPRVADRFKEVNAAYAVVGDEKTRARFDRGEIDEAGNERGPFAGYRDYPGGGARTEGFSFNFGGGGGAGLDDILEGFFGRGGRGGGGRAKAAGGRGVNRRLKIEVTFEEAARGGTRRVTLPDGRTLDVRIPAGIEDGQQIRLKGQGDVGLLGVEPGDALIEVTVAAHPWFVRKGNDVHLDLPISLKEAALGGRVTVPTLDGPVAVKVPKGASSGTILRLRGKGIARKSGEEGDQLIRLMIMLPAGAAAGRLEKLAETLDDEPALRAKLGV